MWKVQLFQLNYDKREVGAVSEVVAGGWITMGERTKQFEKRFGSLIGNGTKATAVSNGTSALHIALLALGLGHGDEVIVPALNFVAGINTIMMVGATPILANCTSLTDWNINPADIERKITPRTKAVMIVHFAGYPCDMDAISAVCSNYALKLIEDCAHSPCAIYKGKCVGSFGDAGCFSFFTNKNLSVGEGGMVTTRSEELHQQVRYLRSHGMTTLTLDRHQGRTISYDVITPGLNYRLDEMRAALGLVQLEKLEAAHKQRKAIVARYIEAFHKMEGLVIPFIDLMDVQPVYHIFPVLLPECCDRLIVIETLKKEGVQASIHYPAILEFSAYKKMDLGASPIANEVSQREITLPLYPTMNEKEVEIVITAFRKAVLRGMF
jgi:dTDP-4-amino-4,6-dideoxygalactose transaminase